MIEKRLKSYLQNQTFEHCTIFDENLVADSYEKNKINLQQASLLRNGNFGSLKNLMYDFHYGYILPKYGKNQKLLFTDTDSLCYEIQTEDFFKDISEDVEKVLTRAIFQKIIQVEFLLEKTKKFPE